MLGAAYARRPRQPERQTRYSTATNWRIDDKTDEDRA